MKLLNKLDIDCAVVSQYLIEFVRQEVTKAGFSKVVLGLSGGIDSALSAYIAKEALGHNNVYAIMMPYRLSSQDSLDDARRVVEDTHINAEVVDISAPADAYINARGDIDKVRMGNIFARMRMITLFDYSSAYNALVLGTSNKTELLLGYGTWYGDMASCINPIGDLYKAQVRQLAEYFKVPESIIAKKPSADLWAGQNDEAELGFSYNDADVILYHLYDLRYSEDEVVSLGFDKALVRAIVKRVMRNQFKRLPPVIAKVGLRTINIDFRYLRDWGL